jgi:hypothetical protein
MHHDRHCVWPILPILKMCIQTADNKPTGGSNIGYPSAVKRRLYPSRQREVDSPQTSCLQSSSSQNQQFATPKEGEFRNCLPPNIWYIAMSPCFSSPPNQTYLKMLVFQNCAEPQERASDMAQQQCGILDNLSEGLHCEIWTPLMVSDNTQ